MYAAGNGNFVKITLAPFAVVTETGPGGNYSALERLGNNLLAVDEATGHITQFAPGASLGGTTVQPLGPAASGGDVTRTSDGTWYWYTNSTKALYTIDLSSGVATAVGTPTGTGQFMTGLVHDDADNLFVIDTKIFPIDKVTGQLGVGFDACLACPTPVPLTSGDTTRTP